MAEKEDFDLDAIIKAAKVLSAQERAQFIELLPAKARTLVLQRLEAGSTADVGRTDDENPPTIVATPGAIVEELPRSQWSPGEQQTGVKSFEGKTPGGDSTNAAVEQGAFEDDWEEPTVLTNRSGSNIESGSSADSQEHADAPSGGDTVIRLIRKHARGAIGEVYVAYDQQLAREVALKRIRHDLPPSERRARRFLREAVLTARLQHPGIVPVYGLGEDTNSLHYTMPLVSGSTLSNLIKKSHLSLGLRPSRKMWISKIRPLLTHFIAVCNAVDYAHSQHVVHRDLKPSNVIIGTQGQTLVLDWGCGKYLGESDSIDGLQSNDPDTVVDVENHDDITIEGSVLGTVQFMSPEQATGQLDQIGPASDIFSLGATLFCILTGDVAVERGTSFQESVDQVREGAFRRVEHCSPQVPPPLAAICHRAMELRPKDRYASAGEIAKDIDAFLADERVTAYRESPLDQLSRFVRQHQTTVTTLLGTLLVGVTALGYVAYMIGKQRDTLSTKNSQLAALNSQLETSVNTERELTQEGMRREKHIRQQLYHTQMLLASEASSEPGGVGRTRELVNNWNGDEASSLRGWEWHHLDGLGSRDSWKTDWNGTANRILTTRDNDAIKIFDAGKRTVTPVDLSGKRLGDATQLEQGSTVIALNHDQSLMAVGLNDGRVRVFDTVNVNGATVEFTGLESAVIDVCWNIGGDYLAASDASGNMRVWQWYEREQKFDTSGVLTQPGKYLMTWSFDGHELAWTTGTEIKGLDFRSHKERVITKDDWIANPCWSHEGKLLAYIGPENTVVAVNPESEKKIRFEGHQLFVESLAWHPSKHYLLSASSDGTVRVWDADTQKPLRLLLGHGASIYAATWRRDGHQVISGGLSEAAVRVWDVSRLGKEAFDRELQDRPAIAWHPDSDQLAVAEHEDVMIQNRLGESRWIRGKDGEEIFGIDFDHAGKRIACVTGGGQFWTVDVQTGEKIREYGEEGTNQFPEVTCKGIEWSQSGRYLAGIGEKGAIQVWDTEADKNVAKELLLSERTLVVSWSMASKDRPERVAFAGTGDHVYIFDPQSRKIVSKIEQFGWKRALAWSADGKLLAIGDRRNINIWDVDTKKLVATCDGPNAMIWDMDWNHSENRIAALTEDGRVNLWNTLTWQYCGRFDLHGRAPYAIRWSPDGKRLVSTARFGRIIFQDVKQRREDRE